MRTQTTWPMSICLLYWMDSPPTPPIIIGKLSQGKESCPYCTLCVCLFIFKKKGSTHIVQSARCLFIRFLVFYNLYIYNVRLAIYHDILCYHSISPHCVDVPLLFFIIMKIYLSKEKQCYLFVMFLCKYKSSTSCKLHSLSCKNLLVSVKSLSQMFKSHIHKCMFQAACLFIGNISIILCTDCFRFVYKTY